MEVVRKRPAPRPCRTMDGFLNLAAFLVAASLAADDDGIRSRFTGQVRWPNGKNRTLEDVKAGRILRVEEPE